MTCWQQLGGALQVIGVLAAIPAVWWLLKQSGRRLAKASERLRRQDQVNVVIGAAVLTARATLGALSVTGTLVSGGEPRTEEQITLLKSVIDNLNTRLDDLEAVLRDEKETRAREAEEDKRGREKRPLALASGLVTAALIIVGIALQTWAG